MYKSEKLGFQVLLKVAAVFSVTPCYASIQPHSIPSKPKYLPVLSTFLYVVVYCVSLIRNIESNYRSFKSLDIAIDILTSTLSAVLGIAIVSMPLRYYRKWNELLTLLEQTSHVCLSPCKHTTPLKVTAELLVIFAACILKMCYDAAIWTEIKGFRIYVNYIHREYSTCLGAITVLIVFHLSLVIRHRYRGLNEKLKASSDLIDKDKRPKVTELDLSGQVDVENVIKSIGVNYRMVGRSARIMNNIFGIQIMLLIGNCLVVMLESLNIALMVKNKLILSWSALATFSILVS